MNIRVSGLVWLLLHLTTWTLHSCSAQVALLPNRRVIQWSSRGYSRDVNVAPLSVWGMEDKLWGEYWSRRYLYVHNETQIAMARAEAEAARRHGGGGAAASSLATNFRSGSSFPDFAPSENGCSIDSGEQYLNFYNGAFALQNRVWTPLPIVATAIEILAIDSCAKRRNVHFSPDFVQFELCSQRWVKAEEPDLDIRDNSNSLMRSFKVLVKIRTTSTITDVLAEGVYFPATGKMHLVGCARAGQRLSPSAPPGAQRSTSMMMNVSQEIPADSPSTPSANATRADSIRWIDPDAYHKRNPLNWTSSDDCAISVTVQYPPLKCRWNTDRVLKYSIRSKREKDDPLFFEPIEESAFFPYLSSDSTTYFEIQVQRRLETLGRILLLVLGLFCVALQIEHGRNNEEALPYVSLVMLGIQLAHHVSQTSIFKDLQIDRYHYPGRWRGNFEQFQNNYETMAWSEHVPYQGMATAAIFMYVWIFHKVGDRRRIMKLRVLRKRPGAKNAPSDWGVMYATLVIFALLCFLGFFAISADYQGDIRRALTGMTAMDESETTNLMSLHTPFASGMGPYVHELAQTHLWGFVPWRFYELAHTHFWRFVNRLTGLVVSLFLVPQVLGNMQWELQGRPLSAWFYAGIPFLQSLPHAFCIAKYFEILPIFPFYDPYFNSIFGIFENPTPWWHVAVVLGSALQVLAVHSQFSRSLISASQNSNPKTVSVQSCDML